MSSDMKLGVVVGGQQKQQQHPPEPENLQCPRCESTNTKFCYYNNYNLSQPRYFCKSCRRYWTRGGSLRNIPVGGGTRKNSKRPRPSPAAIPETPVSFSVKTEPTQTPPPTLSDMNLNDALPGTFSSLLGSNHHHAGAYLGLGGYSLGPGPVSSGFDMLGFGFAPPMVDVGVGGENGKGGNTWQMDGGLTDAGDCFGWPELAISTPGTAGLE